MSKGSTPRPPSVNAETFAANYDRIFGNRDTRRKGVLPVSILYGAYSRIVPGAEWEEWLDLLCGDDENASPS